MAGEEPPTFSVSVEGALPPAYDDSSSFALNGGASTHPTLTEHVYILGSEKRPWAFLKVNSRSGKSTSMPLFVQSDAITGTVELDLDKPEHIEEVKLEVSGQTWLAQTRAGHPLMTNFPFLSQSTVLWSTSMDNPDATGSTMGNPKLKGKYVWPFSINMPEKVMASSTPKGPLSEYSLPPSFSERASTVYLDYKISVTFCRGRFRIDNTLFTPFVFLPRSRPSAPSTLRQLAYREDWVPPGPQDDAEGWKVLGIKSVIGTLFDSRQVEVACSLALSKPLCYARGTSIPFALTLTCSDRRALDLFTARGALTIRLIRTLLAGGTAIAGKKMKGTEGTLTTSVGTGVYWASSEDDPQSETRKLEGEIPLKENLKPSFIFPQITVKYHVTFPLTVPGFRVLCKGGAAPKFSREVAIVTDRAPGPVHRSRVPPGYDDSRDLGTPYWIA